ncbi:hypothetical protein ABZ341_03615 [Streptomyces sp. NPDC006173]|jgi:hypothetical protein|uniref:hypothetical protein n=1 Tax=Streptomyces sp. NPDC006173 TaxID=3155349 RepID=UPI0033C19251
MSSRKRFPAVPALTAATALSAVLCLTGCGTHRPAAAPGGAPDRPSPVSSSAAAPSSPHAEPDRGDSAPHNEENNVGRRPGEMTAEDRESARKQAAKVRPVLEKLRAEGRIGPDAVRPALAALGFPPADLRVQEPWSRWNVDHSEKVPGTLYGIRIGATACVSGMLDADQVWTEVTGPYPETGCVAPPVAH